MQQIESRVAASAEDVIAALGKINFAALSYEQQEVVCCSLEFLSLYREVEAFLDKQQSHAYEENSVSNQPKCHGRQEPTSEEIEADQAERISW